MRHPVEPIQIVRKVLHHRTPVGVSEVCNASEAELVWALIAGADPVSGSFRVSECKIATLV